MSDERSQLCEDLVRFQRQKMLYRKSRIKVENQVQAAVACSLNYESRQDVATRKACWAEAGRVVKGVLSGEESHALETYIKTAYMSIKLFADPEKDAMKAMEKLAKQLHVADWVLLPEQRGFGLGSLATVIGQCGDLSNYANPGKVWRRMGCAPFTSDGKTLMGSTWRGKKHGTLSKAEWEEYGYSPHRRSDAYLIGAALMKQNKGIYRERYEATKAAMQAAHPEYPKMRCDLHGMLLATKLLLKNLWIQWEPSRVLVTA